MQNWSGYLQWTPSNIFYPQSEEEIQNIIKKALEQKKKVRMIGSGHSFMPLSETNHFLLSLDQYQGLISIDLEKKTATVKAGTKLSVLNQLLHQKGLALENMGDIDAQSIAGAIATGTHGTGTSLGNISTQVEKIKFINGLGEIVTCSLDEQASLFKAAQISLGVLGVIVEITLRCVPAFKLELIMDKGRLDQVLDHCKTINQENRNFEFYWFPNTPYVMTKKSNLTNKEPDQSSFSSYVQEIILENYGFKMICEMAYRFPSLTNKASQFAASTTSFHRKVNYSHKVFVTERMVKFNEMEYSVPIEAYTSVKKEIVRWVNKNNRNVVFPIENRFVKGDDIYLSPAYKRDAAYIAVHVYHKKDFKPYFHALEEIFLAHEGRPHWGKRNQLNPQLIADRYPEFDTFQKFRIQHDPEEIFLSPYLKSLFSA